MTMTQTDVATDTLEQLWTLWSGYTDGADYASQHPAVNPYLDADQVVATAAQACERRQHTNTPLDPALVHPAYTYGWMAGYLATLRGFNALAGGATVADAANAS